MSSTDTTEQPTAEKPPLFSGIGRMVLLVADPDAALAFYRDVLDFTVVHDETVGGYRYLHIAVPGQAAVGLWLMSAMSDDERAHVGRQTGAQPLMVLYTGDLDQVRSRLRAHDTTIWADQTDVSGRSLHFADLYGNTIVVAQLA